MNNCTHSRNDGLSWWEHDARGIPLARVCDQCIVERLRRYAPGVLTDEQRQLAYPGSTTRPASYLETVEEPIEPEDY